MEPLLVNPALRLQRPHAIIWDFDDTIIQTTRSRSPLLQDVLLRQGVGSEVLASLSQKRGLPFKMILDLALPGHDQDAFLIDYSKALIANPPLVCPGVRNLLRQARRLGVVSVIVSSSALILIETDLRTVGLDPDFKAIFAADKTEFAKPDPRSINEALDYLALEHGISHHETILLGDSLDDQAAAGERVDFYGVLSGRTTAQEFIEAGVPLGHLTLSLETASID